MEVTEAIQAEVLKVINRFTESYQKRDLDGLMSLFPADDDLMLFGTNLDEVRQGRDELKSQFERDWSQMDALAINFTWHRVSTAGSVAWVASEGRAQGKVGGQEVEFPCRMTTVLENRNNDWLIRQLHFALPVTSQEEGSSVPV